MSQDQQDALYPAYVKMGDAPAIDRLRTDAIETLTAPAVPEATIVQHVEDLFRLYGFEVRENAGIFALLGSLDSGAMLVEALMHPAAPALQVIDAPRVEVPEGFALVPINPTPKMVDATFNDRPENESHNARNKRIYAAMLAAAPALPIARQAQPTDRDAIPDGWREQMQSIIKWLHDSVNTVGNTPEDHGYASEFDYNLSHAAATIESMLNDIGALKSEQKG